jgi:hypothetical protein
VSFFGAGFLPSTPALADFFALADFKRDFLEDFFFFEPFPSPSSSHQKRSNSKEGLIFK